MSFPGLRMGKPEMALGAGKNFGPSWIAVWVDNERQELRLRMGTWGVKLTELDSGGLLRTSPDTELRPEFPSHLTCFPGQSLLVAAVGNMAASCALAAPRRPSRLPPACMPSAVLIHPISQALPLPRALPALSSVWGHFLFHLPSYFLENLVNSHVTLDHVTCPCDKFLSPWPSPLQLVK